MTAPEARRAGTGARLALLAVTQFLVATDFDIVFVALPSIGRDLGFDADGLQWVVSAYTVALGGLLLLGGRATDRLGARRVFVAGLVLFGLASLAGGLATTPGRLVTARAVQGVGAALLTPATLRLLAVGFAEGPDRNRAFAVWGVAGSTGAAVGAAGGGLLTSAFGWEAVLLVNVPVALVAAALAPVLLRADGPRVRGPFDLLGAALATTGSTLLVLGIVDRSPVVVLGVVLLGAFLLVERRAPEPLLPRVSRALLAPTLAVLLFMGAVGTAYFLITTQLQDVLGFTVLQAGAAFLPLSALSMVGAGWAFPRLAARIGAGRTLVVGMAGLGVSLAVLALGFGGYATMLPGFVWALFAGIAFPAVFRTAAAAVPESQQGVAGALASTAQYVGGAVGLAVLLAWSDTAVAAGLGAAALALLAAVVAAVLGAGRSR
ncbi:MFS transporter [Pseudonocardia halophobica]|uniref:MFS transporter n=1 Tax=Pseudonocardia halophobica TaxID=29401 RepID=A0A9W6UF73_9PSEU|nr:MFS transporter [Pseudonocardia halophobica]GLL15458.1 MFS transporter [Pseudonocardia halophobica]